MGFVDWEKTYNRYMERLCGWFWRKGVPLKYIKVVKDMYEGDVIKNQLNTSFCTIYWWTYYTNRDEVHMLLLEDIVLVDTIECKGFMLHRSKT